MTDRASAEGLREDLAAFASLLEAEWYNGNLDERAYERLNGDLAGITAKHRAALRDTGPRPDSGIDHTLHYDPSCEECAYLARPVMLPRPDSGILARWPEADLFAALDAEGWFRGLTTAEATRYTHKVYARLSTSRTETTDD